MPETHYLKIQPEYLEAQKRGDKPFEVRRDDRGFQKGDTLVLCKYGRGTGHTGIGYLSARGSAVSGHHDHKDVEKFTCEVTWVLTGGQHGIEPGYIVMGTKPLSHTDLKGGE